MEKVIMMWVTVGLSASTLVSLAVIFGYVLGWANKRFYVEVDPRVEAIVGVLPGANCGGCGYVGCADYAEGIVWGKDVAVTLCNVGGASSAAAIASIMGVEVVESAPYRPLIHCGATYADRLKRNEYRGEQRCSAVNLVADVQGCTYGCLGFGDCVTACDYDAIHIVDGLATVDYTKCIGCKACSKVCPRNIISMAPFKAAQILAVTCSNKDAGKDVKNVCNIGCMGCKACAKISDLFTVENNLSKINYDNYTNECLPDLVAACNKCPQERLVFVGQPTAIDLKKVEKEALPEVVLPAFKTTVDDTEWRG
jgi:Na+-translocating ferredoxin:NAD+ oxidoreductase subunit B